MKSICPPSARRQLNAVESRIKLSLFLSTCPLDQKGRCDEESFSSLHARASLCEFTERASLDGEHRSNTACGTHDPRQGTASHQCSEICGKSTDQKLFREGCA